MKKIGIKKTEIIYSRVHGWKYSFNSNATNIKNYWNKKCRLGVCGDWFLGPKVEHAWLSATSLFKSIK